MNKISAKDIDNSISTIKTVTWDLQAVDEINLIYSNPKGWYGSIEYYIDGMKIRKVFHDDKKTLEEKLQEIKDFILSV